MQGKDENILTSSNKLNGFLRKINFLISHVERRNKLGTINISINSRY